MTDSNGNGNGTKTDIEWIKGTLKEHGETLKRIDGRLEDGADKCRDRHSEIDKELTRVAVKAGFWGALAGGVPAVVAVAILVIKNF